MTGKPCLPGCQCGRHGRFNSEERFWGQVDRTDECWLWTGVTTNGYGKFWVGNRHVKSHRYAYELMVGPVPEDRELDHRHTCPRNCVNPDHLRLVTRKQNNENRRGAQVNSQSGVLGVSWDKRRNKWAAHVQTNGKVVYAQRFDDLAEAEAAVVAKRLELFTHNDRDRGVRV